MLGILYDLEKFHHQCFPCQVSIITEHKSHIQEAQDNPFTKITVDPDAYTSVQDITFIQARPATLSS